MKIYLLESISCDFYGLFECDIERKTENTRNKIISNKRKIQVLFLFVG